VAQGSPPDSGRAGEVEEEGQGGTVNRGRKGGRADFCLDMRGAELPGRRGSPERAGYRGRSQCAGRGGAWRRSGTD
jgi:hypothetical protein